MTPESAVEQAIAMFEYRESVVKRRLPCDPDWGQVMREAIKPALAGERGKTDQEQCAYQAIRLTEWESGRCLAPWSKAFRPVSVTPVLWYRRWWDKIKAFLKRLNDLV
jgi:hypothetical protein